MKTAKYRLDRANIPFTNFNITDTPWVSYVIGSFGDPARVAKNVIGISRSTDITKIPRAEVFARVRSFDFVKR